MTFLLVMLAFLVVMGLSVVFIRAFASLNGHENDEEDEG